MRRRFHAVTSRTRGPRPLRPAAGSARKSVHPRRLRGRSALKIAAARARRSAPGVRCRQALARRARLVRGREHAPRGAPAGVARQRPRAKALRSRGRGIPRPEAAAAGSRRGPCLTSKPGGPQAGGRPQPLEPGIRGRPGSRSPVPSGAGAAGPPGSRTSSTRRAERPQGWRASAREPGDQEGRGKGTWDRRGAAEGSEGDVPGNGRTEERKNGRFRVRRLDDADSELRQWNSHSRKPSGTSTIALTMSSTRPPYRIPQRSQPS